MTNKQILKKAIEKAFENGWKDGQKFLDSWFNGGIFMKEWTPMVIFSHDFAKAFWGEENKCEAFPGFSTKLCWQYHLRQMVLEEEPLKYLAKFLK